MTASDLGLRPQQGDGGSATRSHQGATLRDGRSQHGRDRKDLLYFLGLCFFFCEPLPISKAVTLFKPSMCSKSCGSTLACMGSRMKSIPSRRASFAAGTKSESPENKTMQSTNLFSASVAMSTPIFMSIPFCRTERKTSSSFSWSNDILPLSKSFVAAGRMTHSPLSLRVPIRRATFRFFFRASMSCVHYKHLNQKL